MTSTYMIAVKNEVKFQTNERTKFTK